MVIPSPAWYSFDSLMKKLVVDICKACSFVYTFTTDCGGVSSFNG